MPRGTAGAAPSKPPGGGGSPEAALAGAVRRYWPGGGWRSDCHQATNPTSTKIAMIAAMITRFHGICTATTEPTPAIMRGMVTAAWLLVAAITLTACSTSPAGDPSEDPDRGAADNHAADQADPAEEQTAESADPVEDPAEVLPPTERFPTRRVVLEGEDTRVPLAVHVAAEPAARRQGLMGREELPDRAGMLFLFPEEHTGGFWMKDTLIPLSIAYFGADGQVRRVLDMEPCEDDPCPSYDPGVAYRGALEVNQGAFGQFGLDGTDWRVRLPANLPEPR